MKVTVFKGTEQEGMALIASLGANDCIHLTQDQRFLDMALFLRRNALAFYREDMAPLPEEKVME